MTSPIPAAGTRILFWDDDLGGLQPILDALGVVPSGAGAGQPRDHVRHDVPRWSREELARALQPRSTANPTGGDVLMSYRGWADCRICGRMLGTRDFFGHGFVWPEMADHYVLEHDVWTPGCDEMLAVLLRSSRRSL